VFALKKIITFKDGRTGVGKIRKLIENENV
jgi:hypothetical protein